MPSALKRSGCLPLLAVAWLAASCRQGAEAEASSTTPPLAAQCTGPLPADATACPGTADGLASDAPRVVIGSSCACSSPCRLPPCAFVCNPGFTLDAGGACAATPAGPPAVRYTDNGDGTVTVADHYGVATWLKDASCTAAAGGVGRPNQALSWNEAEAWSGGLADGVCGLTDGSAPGAWRLPTHTQLLHLQVDLAAAHPFTGVQPGVYWSSWTYWSDRAGAVDMYTGEYFESLKVERHEVWPVR